MRSFKMRFWGVIQMFQTNEGNLHLEYIPPCMYLVIFVLEFEGVKLAMLQNLSIVTSDHRHDQP